MVTTDHPPMIPTGRTRRHHQRRPALRGLSAHLTANMGKAVDFRVLDQRLLIEMHFARSLVERGADEVPLTRQHFLAAGNRIDRTFAVRELQAKSPIIIDAELE